MNRLKIWYTCLIIVFIYQIAFLYTYFTEVLPKFNIIIANIYWISAGVLGIIIGLTIMLKVNVNLLGRVLALIILLIGIELIGLLLMASAITSM